ncbi:methyltransferase domain-containing protein [Hungatella hathewayi]|uniref:Methyltransferase domain-containing protein n=2 Tax=Lachnospiraceae TaxID=186803 RepID=A0A3E2WIF6_9FIRM|nr:MULTISPECIES: methyltransferase domain-containing protein [Clostridia]RGC26848.1 methyltransferase domain-containing protein [Hungatella hathewayi]GKH31908.1 hypothetical protein CE91St64_13150 [Faecalicatena contorta]
MSYLAQNLVWFRKKNGLTQDDLATRLGISYQAVSKWENNQSLPDVEQLVRISDIFHISMDALMGHTPSREKLTQYEAKYLQEDYYWGLEPSPLCYEVMRLKPPTQPWRVLDIGCGEGKDAVFFARNGYDVSAFDLADQGLEKAKKLAAVYGVEVNFFQADVLDFRANSEFDIVFSSGVLHYLTEDIREAAIRSYKEHTANGGIHALNVFVSKPFLSLPPDEESPETLWRSGELAMLYHDWHLRSFSEEIFDCSSSGIPHKHCMDVMIAENGFLAGC